MLWKAKPVDTISHAEINAAQTELTELYADRDRLTQLQADIKKEPLLLHNCHTAEEWPTRPLGLGLTPWGPRTLREALDSMQGRS